ncbi:hypothetical protein CSA37_07055 [Candidatus Fermentibacteria bacterium]|nr:MAG: hypothetical protein CSA37_09950 [Candidatus Fermentibacteria bacterium]PIE52317.1 MAG: hypothetical protein CSA37_07055 [Candidatus Fermentibacteria bacterium]
MKKKKALGRGLNALLPEMSVSDEKSGKPAMVSVDLIDPNPFQPRIDWDEQELESLSRSISQQGILQPLVLRKADQRFQLIAGERRLRASRLAGLSEVPAFIREADDRQMMALALVENIQRQDLNPMEKAEAFSRFCAEFNLTQDELGKQVGISRSAVANFQRLMELPDDVKTMLRSGELSMGHGRALLALKTSDAMVRMARQSISRGYSVRAVEEEVRKTLSGKKKTRTAAKVVPEIRQLEKELQRHLSTRVVLKDSGGKGKLEIEYQSLDELDRILHIIRGR